MSNTKTAFEKAAQEVQGLRRKPSNDMLLRLYALYKQATAGDASGDVPGMMEFVARAKYDAWAKLKGTGREDAMKKYVALVNRLKGEE
ncbi:MAG TPA: acyl-CoA-binding protein [Burkholderiales bacterium]